MSCKECGSTINLVDHHISYDPEIKIILCRKHHAELHAKDRRSSKPNTLLLSRRGATHIPDLITSNLQIDNSEISYLVCPDIVLLYNPNRLDKLTENLKLLLCKILHMNGDLDQVREYITAEQEDNK